MQKQCLRVSWFDFTIERAKITAAARTAAALVVRLGRSGVAQVAAAFRALLLPFTPNYATCAADTRDSRAARAVSLATPHGADLAVLLIIASMFTVFCMAFEPTHSETIDRFAATARNYITDAFTSPAQAASGVPDVLVVSANDAPYRSVIGTLSPRGVRVLLARDTASASNQIGAHESLGMLVVDSTLAGRKRLVRDAKTRFPNINVLVLDGTRQQVGIAAALLDYASRAVAVEAPRLRRKANSH